MQRVGHMQQDTQQDGPNVGEGDIIPLSLRFTAAMNIKDVTSNIANMGVDVN